MFNYPVKVQKINRKYKAISKTKLKCLKMNRLHVLTNHTTKGGLHFYDIDFDKNYAGTEEGSALWAALEWSKLNFDLSLGWVSFPKNNLIVPIFEKSKSQIEPAQIPMVLDYILKRPEEEWIKYVEDSLIIRGVMGIISSITELENMWIGFLDFHCEGLDPFARKPEINKYNFDDIDKYAYHCDSLIDKFLIKTDGFNQCFRHNKENYSSVSVKKNTYEPKKGAYKVYIYGCDDSSYTKHVDTLEAAETQCKLLTRLSTVINRGHIKALEYTFTN